MPGPQRLALHQFAFYEEKVNMLAAKEIFCVQSLIMFVGRTAPWLQSKHWLPEGLSLLMQIPLSLS